MTSQELQRSKRTCWAVAIGVGAADLALFFWLDGIARLGLDGASSARFWAIVLAIGAALFSLSAGLLAWALVNLRRARASARWPVAAGEVLASDIEVTKTRGGRMYWPRVRYGYAVLGKPYENDVIAYGLGGFGKAPRARELTARYPAGQAVEVRYDPDDPHESCLQADEAAAWRDAAWALRPALLPFVAGALIFLPTA